MVAFSPEGGRGEKTGNTVKIVPRAPVTEVVNVEKLRVYLASSCSAPFLGGAGRRMVEIAVDVESIFIALSVNH
jgi:hypothetical protein